MVLFNNYDGTMDVVDAFEKIIFKIQAKLHYRIQVILNGVT